MIMDMGRISSFNRELWFTIQMIVVAAISVIRHLSWQSLVVQVC
jgi:hypothetical protein